MSEMSCFYKFVVNDICGKAFAFSQLKGKVVLIVNTASACAFTSQYKELQDLYEKYQDKGFSVIAFPCNQFLSQEKASNEEIYSFIQKEFGITFPVMQKSDVNGKNTNEVFDYLKKECGGYFGNSIKWNFTKFLINREGKVIKRYSPTTTPFNIEKDIQKILYRV